MAIQQRPGSSPPALREAPNASGARYLQQLKPILTQATNARATWVRFLNEVSARPNLAEATSEATQVALGQSRLLGEARRQLIALQPPQAYETMHSSIESWLRSLELSCQLVVKISGPLTGDTISKVRRQLHEAAADADRFNAERAAIQAVAQEAAAPTVAKPKVVANKRELRAVGIILVILLALIGAGVFLSGALSGSDATATPTVSPANATATAQALAAAGSERRVFTQPDIQQRLNQEIATRRIAYQDATVRLQEPDRLIVSGRVIGPSGPIPVEAELQVSVENGKPKLTTQGLKAVGVEVPKEAFDALAKRADEANQELPNQLKPGETLLRITIEGNQLVADVAPAPAPAKPADQAAPKP